MVRTCASLLLLLSTWTACLYSQGLVTSATKDDWEEINFEFNSPILSDGYPSLLRLADLLKENADYKVRLDGHADWIGSNQYNDKLGMARANAVKAFLEKYGARASQITIETQGERAPKVENKTKEGRFMNRRVSMTVTDGQGRTVGAGGVGDAIKTLEKLLQKQEECCNDILKRLDKLDEIMAMLRDLKGENAALRKDMENLKQQQAKLEAQPPPPPPPVPNFQDLAEKAAEATAARTRQSRFSLLGLNVGADDSGDLTFTGRGRFFAPFRENIAIQAQGEFLSFQGRKEGQFDFGLVNRWKNVQAGLFSSFKTVSFSEFTSSGTMGQASFTFDYLFRRGRVGVFGSKGFLDNAVVNRRTLSRNAFEETYLKVVDQVGASASVGLFGNTWMEGNLGYLKSRAHADRPGGTIRLVHPISDRLAFTVEGGFNETLLTRDNSGRVVAGILFGNFIKPKEFVGMNHPVPVDIPRVRYEMLTRVVRTGNDAPVADAGADQIGIPAGTVTLDGSASFDPDGDPITFQWSQVAGPAVSISGMNQAAATFTAAEGERYSFRLLVKDDKGAQAIARVNVVTRDAPRVRILRFTATPQTVRLGTGSTLTWQVENADEVTISGIGRVDARGGTTQVTPQVTTVYTLTAKNRSGEVSESVSVTVERPQTRVLRCTVSPANIAPGEASTLSWETENADDVSISGIGAVTPNGNRVVTPAETTTYLLTARGPSGEASCPMTVQVGAPTGGAVPRILEFSGAPPTIEIGESATLRWRVENADEVSISTLGRVEPAGESTVRPTDSTTYTLTARNRFGEISAAARITVVGPPRIISFTATPNPVGSPNDPVTLTWQTENASEVVISEAIGPRPSSGSVTLRVARETTFVLVAVGRRTQATARVTVTVGPPPPPANRPPVARAGDNFNTVLRDVILNGSNSFDPDGDPLTFSWTSTSAGVVIESPTSAITRARVGPAFGPYTFELTVTDKNGASTKSSVTATFLETQ